MLREVMVTTQEEIISAELRQWRRRRESRAVWVVDSMRCGEQPYVGEVGRTTPGWSDQMDGGVLHCRRRRWKRDGGVLHCRRQRWKRDGGVLHCRRRRWKRSRLGWGTLRA